MAISLYDVSVRNFLQTLEAVDGFLAKGLAHCKARGIDPDEIVSARLCADMLDFRFQVLCVARYAEGAFQAAHSGLFRFPVPQGEDYGQLQQSIAGARTALDALRKDEVEALQGRSVAFEIGSRRTTFAFEDFVMSFAQPNFHFHATTAYDILRLKGVPVGKRDYLGRMRLMA